MPADRGLVEAARRALPGRARRADRHLGARRRVARLRGRGDGGLRASCAPPRSPACPRSRCGRSRTRSPSPTATRWRFDDARETLAAALPLLLAGDRRCLSCRAPLPPGGAHGRAGDRRDDPRLRRQLLARAAARAAARGRRRSCRSATRRRCRWSCSSRSRRSSPRPSSGPARSSLDARPTPTAFVCAVLIFAPVPFLVRARRAAGHRVARAVRAGGPGGDGRAPRLPRRARARAPARRCRLRARARLARGARSSSSASPS